MIDSSYYKYVEEVKSHDLVKVVISFSRNISYLDNVDLFAEEVVDECTWAYDVDSIDIKNYYVDGNKINAEFMLYASGTHGYTPEKITGRPEDWFPYESELDFEDASEVDEQLAFKRINEIIKKYNYDILINENESSFEEPYFDDNFGRYY